MFAGARHINIDMVITKWAIRYLTPVSGCPKTFQCVRVLWCQMPGFLLSVSRGYISIMNHCGISLHSGEPEHYVQGNKYIHYISISHSPIHIVRFSLWCNASPNNSCRVEVSSKLFFSNLWKYIQYMSGSEFLVFLDVKWTWFFNCSVWKHAYLSAL